MSRTVQMLLVIPFVLSTVLPCKASAQTDSLLVQLGAYLEDLAQDDAFSLSIAVRKGDDLVFSKAYGFANQAFGVKADTATLYNVASIGKLFTATAILQLVQSGQLELDRPIGEYLPRLKNEQVKKQCTIHQLLTHTSGLPLWFSLEFIRGPKHIYRNLTDYWPLLEEVSLDSTKVGAYHYSNVGFFLLGALLEQVSGMPYEAYIKTTVFDKAGMSNAHFFALDAIKYDAAVGYNRPGGPADYWKPNHYLNLGSNPAGGSFVNPNGLLRFITALRNGQLLSPIHQQLMSSKQVDSPFGAYGYGLAIEDQNGVQFKGHEGAFFGAKGIVGWYEGTDYSIAMLSNTDQTDFIDVHHFFKTYYTGSKQEKYAHQNTLRLIDVVLNKNNSSNAILNVNEAEVDEDLIQIKAYYFWNKQQYDTAIKLFRLNKVLFPNSERAKSDLESRL